MGSNEKILLTWMFFMALASSVFYFSRLLIWLASKIKPDGFKIKFTNWDIFVMNFTMFVSIACWSFVFYSLI